MNLLSFKVRKANRILVGNKKILFSKNYNSLWAFIKHVDSFGSKKYRFEPQDFDSTAISAVKGLLGGQGGSVLENILRSEMTTQIEEQIGMIKEQFLEITKNKDITQIKNIFLENKKQLNKNSNIPEDDDLSIMLAFKEFECSENKYLISEDEHFWGYEDLILSNFNFVVIRERNLDKIKFS